ncbi:Uncharacterised protein [Brevibacterium casei]|uniref:Uncharacterized protein n=1 Tax=Brevibacterium casei TaxID=33889 RepID=A0A449D7W3_9MICO|nr:hypothetical protein [Brevibacterium casei]VEW13542.1 Uncharacterised protein [Brevibacterium casei]
MNRRTVRPEPGRKYFNHLAEHIDSIEANALYQTDNAAVTGMLWVHAAALTAQALEQVAQRYRGEI